MNQYDDAIEGASSGWGAPFPLAVPATTTDKLLLGPELRLCGWAFGETTGAASAKAYLRNGAGTGATVVGVVQLAPGGAETIVLMPQGLLLSGGLFLDVVSGSLEGSVWIRTAHYPSLGS